MSNHLTQEQFARCFVEGASGTAWEHLAECAACQAELDRFGNTVSSLRRAIHSRVDDRVASSAPNVTAIPRPEPVRRPRRAWAAAMAASLILGTLPFLMQKPQEDAQSPVAEASPEALMNAVNLHLSRTMPSPMEPILSLIPRDIYLTELGGVQ